MSQFAIAIRALLPKGHIWNASYGGDFDKFITFLAGEFDRGLDFIRDVENNKIPNTSELLIDDWAYLYKLDEALSLSEKQGLATAYLTSTGNQSQSYIQARLQQSGYDATIQESLVGGSQCGDAECGYSACSSNGALITLGAIVADKTQKAELIRLFEYYKPAHVSVIYDIIVLDTDLGIFIPMYIYPSAGDPSWDAINTMATTYDVPIHIVVNPSSGPGASVNTDYETAITTAQGNGIKVYGYVDTNYTAVSLADAKTDIDYWYSLYPTVDGIFLDNQPSTYSTADSDYYKELKEYAENTYHADEVITNPHSNVIDSWFIDEMATRIVHWEDTVYPTSAEYEVAEEYRIQKAFLAYNLAYVQADFEALFPYYTWFYHNTQADWGSIDTATLELQIQHLKAFRDAL